MSKLLFSKKPLVIDVELAEVFGLNESIVLQQIHFWLEINKKANKNFEEGYFWTYNSMESWQKDNFPFWSIDTVKRTFGKLVKSGILISDCFNKKNFDKTRWYRINYEQLEYEFEYKKSKMSTNVEISDRGKMHQSIDAKCTDREGQNAPIDRGKMHQSIDAKCTDREGQNAPTNTIEQQREKLTEINTTTEPTTDTEHTNDGYSEQEKNVVVSASTTEYSTDIGIENDDIKKTPDKIPDVEVSETHNISDTIKIIIYDNFSITLSKTQIEKLTCACNNDLELFNSKVELLKQQSEVNNIFGWLVTSIKKDYQPNTYTNTESKKNKNKIVNYKGHDWDYEELEKMEQLHLETSLDTERIERIKAFKVKINKEFQKVFNKTFDDIQLDSVFRRCKGNFDTLTLQLEKLKDIVKLNPESSLYKLYLSIPT